MNSNDYTQMVRSLSKPGHLILQDMSPQDAHLLHMVVGVCGEAGELLDAIKKRAIYNKPLDFVNVVEELGDLEFYLAGLRDALGISRESVLIQNSEKLRKRYSSGSYTNTEAQARADKDLEKLRRRYSNTEAQARDEKDSK